MKCAVNSELKLFFVTPFEQESLICVNMVDKKVVFTTDAYLHGHHSHHWIMIQDRHFLSAQSAENVIKFFDVSDDGKHFTEDESLTITLAESEKINYCEFDKMMEYVYLVKNRNILEKRMIAGDHGVVMSLPLQEKVGGSDKQLCLSDDGKWCGIAGGFRKA